MATDYNGRIVLNGLVAYYDVANPKCNEGSISAINNLAPNSDIGNGALVGNTSIYGGIADGVIELGGGSGSVNDGTYFEAFGDLCSTINRDFTSFGWQYATTSGAPEILSYRHSSRRLSFYTTTGTMAFVQRRNVSPFDSVTTSVSVNNPLNTWGCFCLVRSGNTFHFYKNGELVESKAYTLIESLSTSARFHVGIAWSDDDFTARVLDGYVGPTGHYTRALSADEVRQNFEVHRGRFGL